MTSRSPIGLDDLVAGEDQAPTVGVADLFGAEPPGGGVRDTRTAAHDGKRSGTDDRQADPAIQATEEREVDLRVDAGVVELLAFPYPSGAFSSRSTTPSNCHKGLGASPVGVLTTK